MRCPVCANTDTRVVDSRVVTDAAQIRRRRACEGCGARFTTFETAEVKLPRIIKSDGTREPFDEAKLRRGMERSLYKRSVTAEQIDEALARIKRALLAADREIPAREIGTLAMSELHELDHVAYVRFASVYKDFQDIEAFRAELDTLATSPSKAELDEHQLPLIGGSRH